MDEQKKKTWYKSKLFFVPALLVGGMIMGSAMATPSNQSSELVSPVKGTSTVPTDKVEAPKEPTVIPTQAVTSTPVPTRVPTKVYIAPTKAYVAPTAKPYVSPVVQRPTVTSGGGGDKDCGDFSSHAEAQSFFIANGGPGSDPHRLDRDNDGQACETLP